MASRRKALRKRPHQSKCDALMWAVLFSSLVFCLCLCAFNFELASNGQGLAKPATSIRLEVCRSSCDERVHSAALERSLPSSLSSSAMDALFVFRDADDRTSPPKDRVEPPTRSDSQPRSVAAGSGLPTDTVRPRRLPPLIKILTGFEDEPFFPYGGGDRDGRTIVRLEKPFAAARPLRRRGDRISNEETVQMAAAAAAAAVWSESARTRAKVRMKAINAEWEAALRWIAGWDQQLSSTGSEGGFAKGGEGGAKKKGRNDNGAKARGEREISQEGKTEEFDDFIDDLAMMLEECIVDCLEDPDFEDNHRKQRSEWGMVENTLVGGVVIRSVFRWVTGLSVPAISFGKLDMISTRSKMIAATSIHLVLSSIAIYAISFLWTWGSALLANSRAPSQSSSDAPEWLIEWERDLAEDRRRLKKPPSKRARKRHARMLAAKDQTKNPAPLPSHSNTPIDSNLDSMKNRHHQPSEPAKAELVQDSTNDGEWQHSKGTAKKLAATKLKNESERNYPKISIQNTFHNSHREVEAPSSASLSSSSLDSSSSPHLKPIGSQFESQCILDSPPLRGISPSIMGWNSPLDLRTAGANHPTLPQQQKPLAVPTQEQRNEAANRLREFQAAQIQRIMDQKQFGQALRTASALHQRSITSTTSSDTTSLNTAFGIMKSGQLSQSGKLPLQPPPGLVHPSEMQQDNTEDLDFLTGTELLLSKLLDDDDNDDNDVILSRHRKGDSMSSESSLDPSAAPFVVESSGKTTDAWAVPKQNQTRGDSWSNDLSSRRLVDKSLNGGGRLKVGGVYGGSVW